MTRFEPGRLNEWLRQIATTRDDEIDCDELAAAIGAVVESGVRGDDLRATLPQVAVHLDHCPDCREWYETLVELARELD